MAEQIYIFNDSKNLSLEIRDNGNITIYQHLKGEGDDCITIPREMAKELIRGLSEFVEKGSFSEKEYLESNDRVLREEDRALRSHGQC